MKQDEIIEMAKQAGLVTNSPYVMPYEHELRGYVAFAKLVHQRGYIDGWSDSDEAKKTVSFEMIANAVEAEREACAMVCEDLDAHRQVATWYSQAIRARGEA